MSEKKTENVIYINDEKHEIDKFDMQQKFLCSQIQNLQQSDIMCDIGSLYQSPTRGVRNIKL